MHPENALGKGNSWIRVGSSQTATTLGREMLSPPLLHKKVDYIAGICLKKRKEEKTKKFENCDIAKNTIPPVP